MVEINTRIFGKIAIEEEKIIRFESGILGFPQLKDFTLIYNAEKGNDSGIKWLQSIQEPAFAMPVMNPELAMPGYTPRFDRELLAPLGGNLDADNILMLVTVTVPKDITKTTVNLRAPIIISTDNRKVVQLICDDEDMLALSRKKGEALIINNDIEITILEIKGEQVKIGISAPKEVPVYRKEVYIQIQEANKAASDTAGVEQLANLLMK